MPSGTLTNEDLSRDGHRRLGRWLRAVLWITGTLLCLLVIGVASVIYRSPQSSRSMHLAAEVPLPPAEGLISGTDYGSVHGHTLYVAYSSANKLLDIDTATLSVQPLLPTIDGVHGVAFSDESRLAFASAGRANDIVVLQMPEATVVARVHSGVDPDGIVFDRKYSVAYAGNAESHSATLIPADDPGQAITIPLAGSPEFPQVDQTTGFIYQPLEDTNEVVVVDPAQKKVVSHFAVSPCQGPKGSAIDPEHKVLFVGCSNRLLAVMELVTGRVIATVPIGRFVDVVGWDPGLQRIYTANSAGTMTVIARSEQGTYAVVDTVTTRAGGHTLAVDPVTHKVYVICSRIRGAEVLVYEPSANVK